MAAVSPDALWSPSALSPRVERLRQQYWDFYGRRVTNEVRAYTTGTPWDEVYSPWNWTNVPEMADFLAGAASYLLAAAEPVSLPDGFWREPLVVRRALFFRQVLAGRLPVEIFDGELIVGSHFNTAMSRCLTRGEARARGLQQRLFLRLWRWLNEAGVGNCGAIPGHLIPDYRVVLRHGFCDIARQAEHSAETAGGARAELARAVVICADAVRALGERYATRAEALARASEERGRREELSAIAARCRKVPWSPAESFAEALQALWTTHMLVLAAESYPGPGVSPGRIDQYLLPYYRRDIESGRLTREGAAELLQCLFVKHNYAYDYQGWVGTNQGINASFGQLITLGGIDAAGDDASNELTFLLLDVIEQLNLLEPKPNVRLHAASSDRLVRRVVDALARAQGAPFLLNFDERAMAGLRWQGLPEDELWDYAPVGCLENTLAGCDRSGTVDVNLNLAKAVELALADGRDQATGRQLGPRTGDARRFRSFEQLWQAFARQLRHLLRTLVRLNDVADIGRATWEPTPYLAALIDGCLASGRDSAAGGARFNFITVHGVALATTADSLAAVERLVFDEGRVSMAELLQAIADDFEGHEPLRQLLVQRAPKYGNDDERADAIARRVSRLWTEDVFRYHSPTGKRYRGGYLSWNYWIAYAPSTAATPDGRRRGQFLSNGVCPVAGADRGGPTAVVRSVGRLGLESAPNGASHTISFSPSLLREPESRAKLAALLRAYGQLGGTCLQVNVVDAETLRAAVRDPDAYRNLLVRVTGYNAYFVGLGSEIQREIIARESHGER